MREKTAGSTLDLGVAGRPARRSLGTMQKLILLSVIIASIVIPIRATRAKNARLGLRKALIQMAVFNLFYLFLLIFVWNRFS